ncbi:hypothetical protein NHX12_003108 [Muraenolepis orangiensis]|uniref:Uncharacterized protein n=1 Tax=Muraenolepis orangiensis TaxID=630683 RepID=A0A9Q0DVT8_9TELE|nr:hypothetical protein NHX12_003108 [Muraenolepis orangiensis]
MLRWAASHLVILLFWGHFRIQTAAAVSCSVNVTEVNAATDSVVVKVTTPGSDCNFTVFYNATPLREPLDCHPHRDYSDAYVCHMRPLEAGTLYSLVVRSQNDGERADIAVRTVYMGLNRAYMGLNRAYMVGLNRAYMGLNRAYMGLNRAYMVGLNRAYMVGLNRAFIEPT